MKRILLYGDSLFTAGIAANLQAVQGVEVAQSTDLTLDGPWQRPGLVIVETGNWSCRLNAWCAQNNLPLVSVDMDNGTLTVVSSRSLPAYSVEELLRSLKHLCRAIASGET